MGMNCLKKVNGSFDVEHAPIRGGATVNTALRAWATEFGGATEWLVGEYDHENGSITLAGQRLNMWGLSNTSWPTSKYTLKMSEDMCEIVGSKTQGNRTGHGHLIAKRHIVVCVSLSTDRSSIVCRDLPSEIMAE